MFSRLIVKGLHSLQAEKIVHFPHCIVLDLFDSLSSSLMPLQSPFCFCAAASLRDANWCNALPSTNCR